MGNICCGSGPCCPPEGRLDEPEEAQVRAQRLASAGSLAAACACSSPPRRAPRRGVCAALEQRAAEGEGQAGRAPDRCLLRPEGGLTAHALAREILGKVRQQEEGDAAAWHGRRCGHGAPPEIGGKVGRPECRAAPSAELEVARQKVAVAVRGGRWVEAHRRLRGLEALAGSGNAGELVDGTLRERITRVAGRFEASLSELSAPEDEGWEHERSDGQGLDFAYRLAHNSLQVVASTVFRGIDSLHAFVALCEFDLCAKHTGHALSASPLGSIEIGDGLWHVLKQASVGKEDSILHVSCLDALDEPLGALWVSAYTPPQLEEEPALGSEPLASVGGVLAPPPREGAVRLGYWRSVYAITPLWGEGEAGSPSAPAFRLTFGLCRRPSNARCILRRFMRREVESFVATFRKLMEECHDLQWRAVFSQNADFYDAVRRHLALKGPRAGVAHAPLSGLGFAELSPHLPEDWADYCEPVR